jgi:hypothetical protein
MVYLYTKRNDDSQSKNARSMNMPNKQKIERHSLMPMNVELLLQTRRSNAKTQNYVAYLEPESPDQQDQEIVQERSMDYCICKKP